MGYNIRQRRRNGITNRSFATRLYLHHKSKTKEQITSYWSIFAESLKKLLCQKSPLLVTLGILIMYYINLFLLAILLSLMCMGLESVYKWTEWDCKENKSDKLLQVIYRLSINLHIYWGSQLGSTSRYMPQKTWLWMFLEAMYAHNGLLQMKENSSICQTCLGICFYLRITVLYVLEKKEIQTLAYNGRVNHWSFL